MLRRTQFAALTRRQLCHLHTYRAKSRLLSRLSTQHSYRSGYSLPASLFTDSAVYKRDLQCIWNRSWLFAGYGHSIPAAGDNFVYDIGDQSVIVVRGADERVRAFHNVCRHRNSRLVSDGGRYSDSCSPAYRAINANHSRKSRFVCSYHGWVYDKQTGSLLFAPEAQREAGFDKSQHALHPVRLEQVCDMLFISLAPTDCDPLFEFAPMKQLYREQLWDVLGAAVDHGLRMPPPYKVAHTLTYKVEANWKVLVANDRDCLHCVGNHPEYLKSNYDATFVYSDTAGTRMTDPGHPLAAEAVEEMRTAALPTTPNNKFSQGYYRASRQPLRRGWVSETLDGKPVVRNGLLFNRQLPNIGSLRLRVLPNLWAHLSADYGIVTRLTPLGPELTEAKTDWLVPREAQAGRDYTLDELLAFWDVTNRQDWELCERNQRGLRSAAAANLPPGQLSTRKEMAVRGLYEWYCKLTNNL